MAEPIECNKVFVGGVPYNQTENDVKAYFEKFGEVSDSK